VAAVPVVAIVVLTVEIQVARSGPELPERPAFDHDGRIGGAGPSLRMLWLGDSLAAGAGATTAAQAIPQRVARGLDRPVDLAVLAVSGSTIEDVLDAQLPKMPDLVPDIVLVSIGANDVTHLTSQGSFRERYHELLDRLPEGSIVVLLGVPDMGAPPRFAEPLRSITKLRGEQLEAISQEVAEERGAVYVDIAEKTGPEMRSDTDRYFSRDKYHPSDDGYRIWADAVLEELRPALVFDPPVGRALQGVPGPRSGEGMTRADR
jgi:lysophospholipase L1-like esterase